MGAAAPLSFAAVVAGYTPGEPPATPRSFSKSFHEVFENKGVIQTKGPSTFKGKPALFFTKEEISTLSSPFRFAIVGKFPHWRPSMDVIRKFFCSLDLKSLKSVGLLQDNHIIIFINHPEDYSRLLIKSTWYVSGALMKLQKWSPDFFPSYESSVVPVWVGFPGLPIHFFDKSALFNIASIFGTPLKVDESTAHLTRPTVARVCIEVDISKPLQDCLWIGSEKEGFWQEVVFENPPSFCGFCKRLGHEEDSCGIKNPSLGRKKKNTEEEEEKNKRKPISKEIFPIPTFHAVGLDNSYGKEVITPQNQGAVTIDDGWTVQKSKKWKKKASATESGAPAVSTVVPANLMVPESVQVVDPLAGSVVVQSQVEEPSLKQNYLCPSQVLCLTPPNPNKPLVRRVSHSHPSDLFKKLSLLNTKVVSENGKELYGKNENLLTEEDILLWEKEFFSEKKGVFYGKEKKFSRGGACSASPPRGGLREGVSPAVPADTAAFAAVSAGAACNAAGETAPAVSSAAADALPLGSASAPSFKAAASAAISLVSGARPLTSETREVGLEICGDFGPDLGNGLPHIEMKNSDVGPSALNPSGPLLVTYPEDDLSHSIFSKENEVATSLSLIHVKSPLFFSLKKHGISLNHSLRYCICDFLALVAPTLYNDGTEVTWNFIQRRLISYLIQSKIKVTKKLRKAFQIYFSKVVKENQPTCLMENRVSDADIETSEYSDSA